MLRKVTFKFSREFIGYFRKFKEYFKFRFTRNIKIKKLFCINVKTHCDSVPNILLLFFTCTSAQWRKSLFRTTQRNLFLYLHHLKNSMSFSFISVFALIIIFFLCCRNLNTYYFISSNIIFVSLNQYLSL